MSSYLPISIPLHFRRFVHSSTRSCQGQKDAGIPSSDVVKTAHSASASSSTVVDPTRFKKVEPTYLDKHFLVWSGHYKSRDEIPKTVDLPAIEKSRSVSRIRINLGFMVVGLATAAVMIYLGKKSFKQGDSLETRNRAWHQQVKEEYEREQAAASKQ